MIKRIVLLVLLGSPFLLAQQRALIPTHVEVPPYPSWAIKERIQGTLHLTLTVESDGTVSAASVQSAYPRFVDAVTAALKRWKFQPFDSPGSRQLPVEVRFEFVDDVAAGRSRSILDLPDKIRIETAPELVTVVEP